jgi:OmpA-OmpF porin, OOP family
MHRTIILRLALAALALPLLATPADAQLIRSVRNAASRGAERAVEREAERRAEEAAAAALGAEQAAAQPTPAGGDRATSQAPVVLVHYDFVPGDRVLFTDDFATDPVGDFPRRMRFVSGNFETAEWDGRRFVRGTSFGAIAIDLPEVLPERFTLEFDVVAPSGWTQEVRFDDAGPTYVRFSPQEGGLDGAVRSVSRPAAEIARGAPFAVRVMADGEHVKVYMNGTRVANVPGASLGRSQRITIKTSASVDAPLLIGAIRVASGGRELYEVTEEVAAAPPDIPLILHGVTFDVGSAVIRAESAPMLDAVAAGLAANPDVRVRVEGHTDSTGGADTNRALSTARATAVVDALVERGIDVSRLAAAGFGPDQPIADNATPEGRQQNRRVALVRL